MRMFAIATKNGSNAGMSLRRVTNSVQRIEFEPNEYTTLRRKCSERFSKEWG